MPNKLRKKDGQPGGTGPGRSPLRPLRSDRQCIAGLLTQDQGSMYAQECLGQPVHSSGPTCYEQARRRSVGPHRLCCHMPHEALKLWAQICRGWQGA